jgi:hypothetical protein
MKSPWIAAVPPGVWAVCLCGGCAKPLGPSPASAPHETIVGYTDSDWAAVLSEFVRDGLVDYEALKADPAALDRYYVLLRNFGPTTTPEAFDTRSGIVAYWMNAYNACVLLAVLERYPTPTMYDLAIPRLEHGFPFRVDGNYRTLGEIKELAYSAADRDVRVLLGLSSAAIGAPRLLDRPFRPDTLEEQLALAAARALANPSLLQIDFESRAVFVWQEIFGRQDEFLVWWRVQRRSESADLLMVLSELAAPLTRRALQEAVGYTFREIPFERALNRWTLGHPWPVIP